MVKMLEKKGIACFKEAFKKFVGTDYYMLTIMFAAVLNWKFRVMWIVFLVYLVFFVLIMIFNVKRTKFIPIILGIIISLRLENIPDYLVPAVVGSAIVFPVLVYDLYRHKVQHNNTIFMGMVFLLISMVFSIVNAPNFITPFLGVLMMFFYTFLFLYYYNKRGENEDLEYGRNYLARSFNYMILAILIEVILYMLEVDAFADLSSFFSAKRIQLEWAMTNYIAMIILMVIPLSFYLYIKNQKKYHLLIFILIELILLVMMLSRGAYLAILVTFLPFIIVFGKDVKDNILFTKVVLFTALILLLISLTILIPEGIVKAYFSALDKRQLSMSGRPILYRVGLKVFKTYPLFGGGIYTSEYYLSLVSTSVYYHNFFIQTIASVGLIGLSAFSYYLFQILKQATRKGTYNIYVLFIVLNMIIHGLFDTTFYNPLVMVLLSLILPFLEAEKNNIEVVV